MPDFGVLLVRTDVAITDQRLKTLRHRVYTVFRDCFRCEHYDAENVPLMPFLPLPNGLDYDIIPDKGHWYEMNLALRYFSPQSQNPGYAPLVIALAAWISAELPQCELWYGCQAKDESFERLDYSKLASMKEQWQRFSHGSET